MPSASAISVSSERSFARGKADALSLGFAISHQKYLLYLKVNACSCLTKRSLMLSSICSLEVYQSG